MPAGSAVLLVDDEEDIRDVAGEMLRRLGFAVVCAADGSEALREFRSRERRFCAVLLDLTLGDVSGEETCREIHSEDPELPVVIMSGYRSRCTGAGPDSRGRIEFLPKPFTMRQLGETLRGVLGEE